MLEGARRTAAWVLSVFSTRLQCPMLTLHKTMVRPHVENCSPLWDPVNIGDIRDIENIQRQFTRRISSCRGLDYWSRLKTLKLRTLQRRRERYTIIHTWKIANNLAPNDIEMEFRRHPRLGLRAVTPSPYRGAQCSVSTDYYNSFGVRATRLWNLLPKGVNEISVLEPFKVALGNFLSSFPDTPPTKGYTATNGNSLLEWGENLHSAIRVGENACFAES